MYCYHLHNCCVCWSSLLLIFVIDMWALRITFSNVDVWMNEMVVCCCRHIHRPQRMSRPSLFSWNDSRTFDSGCNCCCSICAMWYLLFRHARGKCPQQYSRPDLLCCCSRTSFVMAALCNRAGHYIFALWFVSSSSFSSPNLSRRRLDVYHTSTHGVALVRI